MNIVSDKAYLNSDHYPITFGIMIKCKRRTLEKRSMYNYSRADWPNMLLKLSDVNWEMVLDKLELCAPVYKRITVVYKTPLAHKT